jgi:hypothetical protein
LLVVGIDVLIGVVLCVAQVLLPHHYHHLRHHPHLHPLIAFLIEAMDELEL